MLRLRRSRIVLTISLISCFLFYNLYSKTQAYEWAKTQAGLGTPYGTGNAAQEVAKPVVQDETIGKPAKVEDAYTADAPIPTPTTTVQSTTLPPTTISVHDGVGALVLDTGVPPNLRPAQSTTSIVFIDSPSKALEDSPNDGLVKQISVSTSTTTSTSTSDAVHWTKGSEFFPVPTESLITLPTDKAKKLNKIQHDFKDETALEKGTREKRQAQVLATFKKSWQGYVDFAWLHDELSPTSGKFRDPFCGWSATLVDSLDSLIIMGLDKEFHRALEALDQIDFTTTKKSQIPVFETTIRYLGGLLSAYDLSGQQHKILLDKAKELGEVLYGSFDTPNRMPQTFYSWRPAFTMNPHRASTRVVMAELGSLSMEFTRLAQLTGDERYYDAIARITNEMEILQSKTKLPGLWPLYIDASGCKKPDRVDGKSQNWRTDLDTTNSELREAAQDEKVPSTTTIIAGVKVPVETLAQQNDHGPNKGKIANWDEKATDITEHGKVPTRHGDSLVTGPESKRQLDSAPIGVPDHDRTPADLPSKDTTTAKVDCQPQGLASPPGARAGASEDFSFGGMADSTYEYLPKQFALLGGLVPQYKSMYEDSIEAANKHLLFRPMTPTNEDILVLGKGKSTCDIDDLMLVPDLGHLLCFAGGMYGLGSKMFDRPKDLELAKKMTDACVWAYSITPTGIMPEGMELIKCDSMTDCKWNQTLWEDLLDPYPENRIADGLVAKQRLLESIGRDSKAGSLDDSSGPADPPQRDTPSRGDTRAAYLQEKTKAALPVAKRQFGAPENDLKETTAGSHYGRFGTDESGAVKSLPAGDDPNMEPTATSTNDGSITHSDARIFKHSEYAAYRMDRERLPKGVSSIGSRKYILRPEAIESVFYMYRITGDASWREKGWKMFEAVQAATDTTYGASAILDVTQKAIDGEVAKLDEMESFWLAETLKYFYLLFSDEKLVSLDEWVLNTEAHPFKRPQPA